MLNSIFFIFIIVIIAFNIMRLFVRSSRALLLLLSPLVDIKRYSVHDWIYEYILLQFTCDYSHDFLTIETTKILYYAIFPTYKY